MSLAEIKDIFEIVSFIATTIGMTAIFFGYRSYSTGLKHLSFEIVNNCTYRFHGILKELIHHPNDLENIDAYMGLCNEELFYFKHDYLPKEVIFEWLMGMKDGVPHFVNGKNVNINPKCVPHIHWQDGKKIDILANYPRLRYCFSFPDMETYHFLQQNPKRFIKYVYGRIKKWKVY